GGAQDGTYLHWMVRVVVDDGDAAGLPGLGDTPLYPLEGLQRLAQRLLAQAHLDRHGTDHARVLDVVLCHHPQDELLDARAWAAPAVDHQAKARAAVFQPQVLGGDIRLRTEAVGKDPAILDPGDQGLHRRVVDAADRQPIEGNVLEE